MTLVAKSTKLGRAFSIKQLIVELSVFFEIWNFQQFYNQIF